MSILSNGTVIVRLPQLGAGNSTRRGIDRASRGVIDRVSRRGIDLETSPGRCNNLDYCSLGMQRTLVHVPISQAFVCPECNRALRPPESLLKSRGPGVLPALRIGILAVGMAASLAAGFAIGRRQPAVTRTLDAASHAVLNQLVEPASTATLPAVARPSAPSAAPVIVQGRPYPARLGPVDATAPPAHLPRESRFGQVTVDCDLGEAAAHPVCRVADIRGADAFSAAATAWLAHLPVRYASTQAAQPEHRWRVIFEDFEGQPKRPPP
jgi:hypothetical protein